MSVENVITSSASPHRVVNETKKLAGKSPSVWSFFSSHSSRRSSLSSTGKSSSETSLTDDSNTAEINLRVLKLRSKLLREFETHPDKYDPIDVDRIKRVTIESAESSWPIRRFLKYRHYRLKSAFKLMCEAYRWRKEFGVNHIKMTDFPREPFICGGAQTSEDRRGYLVVSMRGEMYRKFPSINEHIKRGIVLHAELFDPMVGERGAVGLLHAAGTGFHSIDMDLARFLFRIKDYYPMGCKLAIINDLPWMLTTFANFFLSWFPEDLKRLVRFTKSHELDKYISPENLPTFIPGGTMKLKPHLEILYQVTDEMMEGREWGRENGIPEKHVNYLLSVVRPYLDQFNESNNNNGKHTHKPKRKSGRKSLKV